MQERINSNMPRVTLEVPQSVPPHDKQVLRKFMPSKI